MLASEIIAELQSAIAKFGNCEVDISLARQPEVEKTDQAFLVSSPQFLVPEEIPEEGTRFSLRDWPY